MKRSILITFTIAILLALSTTQQIKIYHLGKRVKSLEQGRKQDKVVIFANDTSTVDVNGISISIQDHSKKLSESK